MVRGITQTELARRLNTTKETVSRLERGIAAPSLGRLARIAHFLNFSLHDFFQEQPEPINKRLVESMEILEEISSNATEEQWQSVMVVLRGLKMMRACS